MGAGITPGSSKKAISTCNQKAISPATICAALAEDLGSVPSIYMVVHNSSPGNMTFSLVSKGTRHTGSLHTHRQALTYRHKTNRVLRAFYSYFVCVTICLMSVSALHACSTNRGQKRVIDPLRQELQAVTGCLADAGY